MATIQTFPQNLIDEHMAWHMNTPNTPGARSTTNRGLDFLNFHHNFLQKVFLWFNAQPLSFRQQYDLTPSWHAIPMELKLDTATGWNTGFASDEQRITTLNPAFSNEDNFGSFIELGLHNQYLHGACAVHYNDPNIGSPMTDPVISTWFYKIHGLVDFWWANYKSQNSSINFDQRFMLAAKILFGVANDAPGVVLATDGKPHPVDPWGPMMHLSQETKQTVVGIALNHLAEGMVEEKAKNQILKIVKGLQFSNMTQAEEE